MYTVYFVNLDLIDSTTSRYNIPITIQYTYYIRRWPKKMFDFQKKKMAIVIIYGNECVHERHAFTV